MHPGVFAWWSHAQRSRRCGVSAGCGTSAGGGPGFHEEHHHRHDDSGFAHAGPHDDNDFGGGGFGVRRPLRFLAHKLDLDDRQVAQLAHILDNLKTERAQAAVDHRRTTSTFADAVAGDAFDPEKVNGAAAERVKSAERLRDAVVKALSEIHALLNQEQRQRLAYLLRTGGLSI